MLKTYYPLSLYRLSKISLNRTYAATIAGIPDNFEIPLPPPTGICLAPRGIPRCRRPLEKGAINGLVSKSPF